MPHIIFNKLILLYQRHITARDADFLKKTKISNIQIEHKDQIVTVPRYHEYRLQKRI